MSDTEEEGLAPVNVLAEKDRITLVLNLHHEHRGDQPTSVCCQLGHMLETVQEPYSRRVLVTEEAKPLDLGWVGDEGQVGLIVVHNLPPSYQQHPTKEQREEDAEKVVHVCSEHDHYVVPPGWPFYFFHPDPHLLKIKCKRGSTFCRIFVFPK